MHLNYFSLPELKKEGVVILGIETSCDETSAAIVVDGQTIASNIISSQIAIHQKYGGVVPEIASRKHLENIGWVVEAALQEAGMTLEQIDGVAVTHGPGLVGALLVGVSYAKALAVARRLPLLGVHHIVGHIYANFLSHPQLELPAVCLVVSGGHTNLVAIEEHGSLQILGRTRDDAAGEAFDKVARALGLGYPGGPKVEKEAALGNPQAIPFPRARLEEESLDFSFSGLKSAVLNYLNRAQQRGEEINRADLTASFQQAVVDILVEKSLRAVWEQGAKTLLLAGGVAANGKLRQGLQEAAALEGVQVFYPPPILCTDNAAMIACAAFYQYKKGEFSPLELNAVPNLPLNR